MSKDEGVRSSSTVDSLAKLRPVFSKNGTTTPGNASQLSGLPMCPDSVDGAAAILLMTRAKARQFGVKPRAVFRSAHENTDLSDRSVLPGYRLQQWEWARPRPSLWPSRLLMLVPAMTSLCSLTRVTSTFGRSMKLLQVRPNAVSICLVLTQRSETFEALTF